LTLLIFKVIITSRTKNGSVEWLRKKEKKEDVCVYRHTHTSTLPFRGENCANIASVYC
jgi:hypothetical protein